MKQVALSIKHLNMIKDILKGPFQVILFGSRVKGTNYDASDIDICLKADQPIPYLELSLLDEALEESDLPYFVDFLDYHRISEDYKDTIDQDGILLSEAIPATNTKGYIS